MQPLTLCYNWKNSYTRKLRRLLSATSLVWLITPISISLWLAVRNGIQTSKVGRKRGIVDKPLGLRFKTTTTAVTYTTLRKMPGFNVQILWVNGKVLVHAFSEKICTSLAVCLKTTKSANGKKKTAQARAPAASQPTCTCLSLTQLNAVRSTSKDQKYSFLLGLKSITKLKTNIISNWKTPLYLHLLMIIKSWF